MFDLIYKLLFWTNFTVGVAPGAVLSWIGAIAMGIIGEFAGAIYTTVLNRPLGTEIERINF